MRLGTRSKAKGLNRIAERILSSEAPPLDVLASIAAEYVLMGGYPDPSGSPTERLDRKLHARFLLQRGRRTHGSILPWSPRYGREPVGRSVARLCVATLMRFPLL
jgi:hypothetical protein